MINIRNFEDRFNFDDVDPNLASKALAKILNELSTIYKKDITFNASDILSSKIIDETFISTDIGVPYKISILFDAINNNAEVCFQRLANEPNHSYLNSMEYSMSKLDFLLNAFNLHNVSNAIREFLILFNGENGRSKISEHFIFYLSSQNSIKIESSCDDYRDFFYKVEDNAYIKVLTADTKKPIFTLREFGTSRKDVQYRLSYEFKSDDGYEINFPIATKNDLIKAIKDVIKELSYDKNNYKYIEAIDHCIQFIIKK